MREDRNYHYNQSQDQDDEIQLYDIVMKIWKWRYLISVIVGISIIITLLTVILSSKPKSNPEMIDVVSELNTYTVDAKVKIGKIANVLIEQWSDIKLYLDSSFFIEEFLKDYHKKFPPITIGELIEMHTLELANDKDHDNMIFYENNKNKNQEMDYDLPSWEYREVEGCIYIGYTSILPEISYYCVNRTIDKILNRHDKLYRRAFSRIRENTDLLKSKMIIDPILVLDSYTYPSSVIIEPKMPISPDIRDKRKLMNSKSKMTLSRKLVIKLAVAFMASLLFGIFLSFFIDYFITERNKRRENES
ncbi:MAG: hypothetical protein SVZ03_12640 [Spirochaetota bacterium]|nr:hypothetical protein [Spirochaetota bacterium]